MLPYSPCFSKVEKSGVPRMASGVSRPLWSTSDGEMPCLRASSYKGMKTLQVVSCASRGCMPASWPASRMRERWRCSRGQSRDRGRVRPSSGKESLIHAQPIRHPGVVGDAVEIAGKVAEKRIDFGSTEGQVERYIHGGERTHGIAAPCGQHAVRTLVADNRLAQNPEDGRLDRSDDRPRSSFSRC